MTETTITRKQQEVLTVNGKVISVEGGAVVNSYDLTDKELSDVIKYMDKNKYLVMIDAVKIELNKKL